MINREPVEHVVGASIHFERHASAGGMDPRSMGEGVARAAETLRTIGAPVLKGDFEKLHERQRKMAEAVRRHNPVTQQ